MNRSDEEDIAAIEDFCNASQDVMRGTNRKASPVYEAEFETFIRHDPCAES